MEKGICLGCLRESSASFCRRCTNELTGGRKINPVLQFSLPEFTEYKLKHAGRLSISGAQIKHLLKFEKNRFVLSDAGGEYILKPVPHGSLFHLDTVPANEHLTMQIARQLFGIETAANTMVSFADGAPAYITGRFDFSPSGARYIVEDFAQIAGLTEETDGAEYKYKYSYEGIARLISRYVAASAIELEKFFRLVLFNYVFSNGDAHLKNFSLYRNEEYGDYLLTPAYDLLCTKIHSPFESDLALDLFADDFQSENYKHGTKYTAADFLEFAKRLNIPSSRAKKFMEEYNKKKTGVEQIISKSFLPNEIKTEYLKLFLDKTNRLSY